MKYDDIPAEIRDLPGAIEYIAIRARQMQDFQPELLPSLPKNRFWRDGEVFWHGDPQGEEVNSFMVGFVLPGRKVVEGNWPYSRPEFCPLEDETKGTTLLLDGEILVCRGCGLDAS